MRVIGGFFRFWYEFIVGDDWRCALGVVTALALTAVLSGQDVAAWWLLPLAVMATLSWSLRHATRPR